MSIIKQFYGKQKTPFHSPQFAMTEPMLNGLAIGIIAGTGFTLARAISSSRTVQ